MCPYTLLAFRLDLGLAAQARNYNWTDLMEEARVTKIEDRINGIAEREADMRVRLASLDVRVESMHRDFDRIVVKLEDIHKSIQPLAEWANKSKGGLALAGTVIGLLFVIIGSLATQVFRKLFET